MCWLGLVTAAVASVTAVAAQEAKMLTFEAGDLRLGLDSQARIAGLRDTRQGDEYLADGRSGPLLELVTPDTTLRPTALLHDEAAQQLRLEFGEAGITVAIAVEQKPRHLALELLDVVGSTPTRINWGPFATTIDETVGATVGVVRNAEFAIGIQSLNIQTVGGAARKDYGSLLFAYAIEHDGGVEGSKIALFGCPAERALETIGQIEIAEGLPHPMLDGEWGKVSPTARRSYLIIPYAEQNIDEVLEVAQQAGFTYVYHPGPFRTWGHFQLNPDPFPDGDASLKRCADRAAEVGVRLGLHTLTGFITTNDPYVTPVPDPRLARMGSSVLTEAIDAQATGIGIADPEPFRDRQTLATAIISEELVQYDAVSEAEPWQLLGCTRGAFGTAASAHEAGADTGKLADHSYRTFYPGLENGMMDEMTDRLVELLNRTGVRQMSFDGLEGLSTSGYGQYARHRFVKRCFDGWQNEVITDASNLLHYLWHIHTRMNWGELTQSAKVDVDVYRSRNCQYFEDNLFPTSMGWWRFGPAGLDWEATRLEDVEYLLAKAAGYNACHALQTDLGSLKAHGLAHECLHLVRTWDAARYAKAFTEAQRGKLREQGRDFHLRPVAESEWALTEVKYSPFYWACPGSGRASQPDPETHVLSFTTGSEQHPGMRCVVDNPFAEQSLRFEMRVVGPFEYDDPGNIDLTPESPDDLVRQPDLHADAPEIAVAEAQVHGVRGYGLSTTYTGTDRPSWVTRVVASLPETLNLQHHRGVGCWVRGDGKGELLFLELVARNCKRQYYVPVDFTGERYFEFPLGEMCLGRYYAHDWNHWSGFASWWVTLKGFDYGHVEQIALGFNAIPPGQEVSCVVGGIRALKELGAGLRNPAVTVGGKTLLFGETLPPGSYLTHDGGPKAQVRDANYRLLRGVTPTGHPLGLGLGENLVEVSWEGADGPAPWARWEFECLGAEERVTSR